MSNLLYVIMSGPVVMTSAFNFIHQHSIVSTNDNSSTTTHTHMMSIKLDVYVVQLAVILEPTHTWKTDMSLNDSYISTIKWLDSYFTINVWKIVDSEIILIKYEENTGNTLLSPNNIFEAVKREQWHSWNLLLLHIAN